jgi:hypothetical protein
MSIWALKCPGVFAQNVSDTFFTSQTPLKIALAVSLKDVEKSRKDSDYLKQLLFYQRSDNTMDSIKVGIKERGNFRSRECYFPPLWIKIKPKDAKGTPFEGNRRLKLVLPCYDRNNKNDLILKEFLCYKLFEEVTPYSFQTRLAEVDLSVLKKNSRSSSELKGIFIEDINRIAKRMDARVLKDLKIHPKALDDTVAARFELFQFMISNTDWSTVHQHNTKLIVQGPNKYISIMYDFDMSGLVDAPYSVVSVINGEKLPVEHVTERLYRGFCRDPDVVEFVRQEYISKEEKYLSIPDQLSNEFNADELKDIKDYLKDFFTILKDDQLFKTKVLDQCRLK